MTSAKLVGEDTDDAFDIYDARVCGEPGTEECPPPEASQSAPCVGEACKGAAETPPSYATPGTATLSGSGNLSERTGVLGTKVTATPKSLTKAEKLALALKACRKDKKKKKRQACEKAAHKRYPAKKASKANKASKARHVARSRRSR